MVSRSSSVERERERERERELIFLPAFTGTFICGFCLEEFPLPLAAIFNEALPVPSMK